MTFRHWPVALLLTLQTSTLGAQEADLPQLREELRLLAGVLEEALDLNSSTGLFGLNTHGVSASYLHAQGAILEVNSPLAGDRNRLQLAALGNALRSLTERSNPFINISGSASPVAAQAEAAAGQAQDFYQDMMRRVADIDFSLVVNTALQQASDAARSLRSIGDMEEAHFARLREAMEEMRQSLQRNMAELSALERSLRAADPDNSNSEAFAARLDALMAEIEPLRDEALSLAADLSQRSEAAAAEFEADWRRRRDEFETSLYQALCDFGASLRSLPDDEHVSIILEGLGDNTEDNNRSDKLHVLDKADVMACQSGAIDVEQLLARGVQYSY